MRIAIAGATGMVGTRAELRRPARTETTSSSCRGASGVDLVDRARPEIESALAGVEAVVDVTNLADSEQRTATEFFTTVARSARARGNPGRCHPHRAAVDRRHRPHARSSATTWPRWPRSSTTRAEAPGAVVLRAAQFHEFAEQTLGWNRDGDVIRVMDVPSQPVDTVEVVRVLLDLATGKTNGDVDLAGPRVERLVDQVRQLVERWGEHLAVEAVEGPASMAGGSMLPGPGALIRGVDWETWLARQPQQHLSRH